MTMYPFFQLHLTEQNRKVSVSSWNSSNTVSTAGQWLICDFSSRYLYYVHIITDHIFTTMPYKECEKQWDERHQHYVTEEEKRTTYTDEQLYAKKTITPFFGSIIGLQWDKKMFCLSALPCVLQPYMTLNYPSENSHDGS